MKKLLLVLAAIVTLAALLVGCNKADTDQPKQDGDPKAYLMPANSVELLTEQPE